jgi:hypothetical protein
MWEIAMPDGSIRLIPREQKTAADVISTFYAELGQPLVLQDGPMSLQPDSNLDMRSDRFRLTVAPPRPQVRRVPGLILTHGREPISIPQPSLSATAPPPITLRIVPENRTIQRQYSEDMTMQEIAEDVGLPTRFPGKKVLFIVDGLELEYDTTLKEAQLPSGSVIELDLMELRVRRSARR